MKLSTAILAGLATVSEAVITCPTGASGNARPLFEVECTVANGFTITVNEACRAAHFPMVDFANSFVWGDSSKTNMVDPSQAGADGIDAAIAVTDCSDGASTNYNVKPATTGVTDSEGDSAFGWATIPLDSCGISATEVTDTSTNNKYIAYKLYWNSLFPDGATQNMYQLGQVQFTCRVDPYQEDATQVSVSEDTSVDNPTEKNLDINSGLTLEINKADFDGTVDESALTEVEIDSGATVPVYGQSGITYSTATAAKLGDYMELKLAEVSSSGVLTDFAVSLTKCWASNTDKAAVDNTDTAGIGDGNWFGDTSTASGAAGEFVFFDAFCPKYPSWVSPNPATTSGEYLMEKWDGTSSLHAVHFRQFGFQADAASYAAGADVYYHCFVKVCDKANKDTCSTTTVTGAAVSCSNSAYAAPSRKRRAGGNDMIKQADLATNKLNVNVVTECPKGQFCLKDKRTADSSSDQNKPTSTAATSTTKTDDNSSALKATSTCAAMTLLAMLN